MRHILVAGGTGRLGHLVVLRLREAGHEVRALSRHSHEGVAGVEFVVGDLNTGEGVDASVEGIETIVYCAGRAKGEDAQVLNMVRAATRAGARHLVYISVVGA